MTTSIDTAAGTSARDAWRLWRLLAENANLPHPIHMAINGDGAVHLTVDDRVEIEAWAEILGVDVERIPYRDYGYDVWHAAGQARISWEGRDELVTVELHAVTPKVRG